MLERIAGLEAEVKRLKDPRCTDIHAHAEMEQEIARLREALHRHHFESTTTDAACPVCFPDDWRTRAALKEAK